jgi:hypothetical protein
VLLCECEEMIDDCEGLRSGVFMDLALEGFARS